MQNTDWYCRQSAPANCYISLLLHPCSSQVSHCRAMLCTYQRAGGLLGKLWRGEKWTWARRRLELAAPERTYLPSRCGAGPGSPKCWCSNCPLFPDCPPWVPKRFISQLPYWFGFGKRIGEPESLSGAPRALLLFQRSPLPSFCFHCAYLQA